MNLSRNFQGGAAIVIMAAMAWMAYSARDGREIDDDGGRIATAAAAPTPSPSTPASTAQPLATTPPLPLPKSRAEILAALTARGFRLSPLTPLQPIPNTTGYRVAGIPAAVSFTERNGELTTVDVAAAANGAPANGPLLLDFAEIVGEVATGRARDTTRQAIAQTMAALGKESGRMSCSFGAGKDRFRLQVTRHDGRGYSFAFTVEPN